MYIEKFQRTPTYIADGTGGKAPKSNRRQTEKTISDRSQKTPADRVLPVPMAKSKNKTTLVVGCRVPLFDRLTPLYF